MHVKNDRRCAVCRQVKQKSSLIRIMKNGTMISIDYEQNGNGRGVYVCKNHECVANATKRKVINRAFSCEVSNEIYDELERCVVD